MSPESNARRLSRRQTKGIPIQTPVQWGKTIFHVDERYNDRRTPRFVAQLNSHHALESPLCRSRD